MQLGTRGLPFTVGEEKVLNCLLSYKLKNNGVIGSKAIVEAHMPIIDSTLFESHRCLPYACNTNGATHFQMELGKIYYIVFNCYPGEDCEKYQSTWWKNINFTIPLVFNISETLIDWFLKLSYDFIRSLQNNKFNECAKIITHLVAGTIQVHVGYENKVMQLNSSPCKYKSTWSCFFPPKERIHSGVLQWMNVVTSQMYDMDYSRLEQEWRFRLQKYLDYHQHNDEEHEHHNEDI